MVAVPCRDFCAIAFFPGFNEIEIGFIAWGTGSKENVKIQEIGLVNVASLVNKLLDLDMELEESKIYPKIKKQTFLPNR